MIALKNAALFVLSVVGKIIAKMTPLVIHELVVGAAFIFKWTKDELAANKLVPQIKTDITLYVAAFWARLNLSERIAFIVAPIILIAGLIYFI